MYKKCDFCGREFENPLEWYILDGCFQVCEDCYEDCN